MRLLKEILKSSANDAYHQAIAEKQQTGWHCLTSAILIAEVSQRHPVCRSPLPLHQRQIYRHAKLNHLHAIRHASRALAASSSDVLR